MKAMLTVKGMRPAFWLDARVIGTAVALLAVAVVWLLAGGWIDHARSAWASPFPALAEGHGYTAHVDNFERRVKAAFPVGSPVADMVRTLSNQGFREDGGSLYADRGTWICTETFKVNWTEADGAIRSISGQVRPSCL